jgi:superfamily II DNA or RNA helicase
MPIDAQDAVAGEGAGAGDWRTRVDDYLAAPAEGAPAPARHTALALQFELRELLPRTLNRWNGPTSRAVTRARRSAAADPDGHDDAPGPRRLGVRPVSRTGRGWARGTLGWSNIPHLLNRLDLDPAQHRWFCQFVALHRAGEPTAPGQDAAWVFLDEFVNPVLWTLLGQAHDLGIAFVGATGKGEVYVGGAANLALDAARDASGGIRMLPRLVLDGDPVPLESARAIGAHGVYAVDLTPPVRIRLAPTEEPLGSEQHALLDGRDGEEHAVAVPAADADEFLRDAVPRLRRRIDVGSADGSVPVPPPAPPVLVLDATFGPRQSLELAWRWERQWRAGEPPALRAVLAEVALPDAWLPDTPGAAPQPAALRGLDAAEFAVKVLPALERLPGVRVVRHGTAPDYRELTGTPQLTVTTVPTEKPDWFDLGVTVTVDGRTIPFVPLFKALAGGKKRLLLIDGSYFSLGHPAFGPLAELIEEAKGLAEWETGPVISRHATSLWADFEDLADESVPAREWRAVLDGVGADGPTPLEPPAGLHAELRPYQREGFAWLAFLWRNRLGAVLADDMGLGKTLQCLALVQHAVETRPTDAPRQPFLVVAPTSVVSNWATEAARFTPGLVVRTLTATTGSSGVPIAETAAGADIVVTSYALLRLDVEGYQQVARGGGWAGLILDEAQFAKNAASQVHACALDLEVRFKLAVTGTPMENSLIELHALFAIVAPGLFASARRFTEEYVRPIEDPTPGISKGRGAGAGPAALAEARVDRLAKLRRRMRPFLLRRTKELVAADLPAKQEQTLRIELAPDHRALYDLVLQRERQKLFGLLEDMNRNRFVVFRSLTLLRLLALDASLVDAEYAGIPSSKLDALLEQLDDVVAEGHRALIFSQFTSYLAKAAARLDAAGIRYVSLDGSTRGRAAVIDAFRDGDAPVFLISLKAGGVGLNLTEADYVFLLDPWWNPASEDQAIDRTHRIGQTKSVSVYRLIAADTIEEKVMALKERKASLFDAVIDDEALFSSTLSADDIRGLLG